MPYDKVIEERIHQTVSDWENTGSKKMFGGICHLLNGNMYCGVYKDYLILRLGVENADKALGLPFTKPFDITGKPMKGWVMMKEEGFRTKDELVSWLKQTYDFASNLPPK
jgi:TfoX/Sxy family transcriptional regulator of competence genes